MEKLVAVLDTSALLAYIKGETSTTNIDDIINNSIMSIVNLTEAIIVLSRKHPEKLEYYQAAINELVSHKYESDSKIMMIASKILVNYRDKHNLSLGDCYCIALGKLLDLPIYTGDQLWAGLDTKIGVTLNFIR